MAKTSPSKCDAFSWNGWLEGSLYLISPFSEHGTVPDYLQRNPNCDRRKFLRDIAAALSFLHSSKIIHGDIKGRNVLLSPHLEAQVCDFGLARYADAGTSTNMKGAGSVRWSSPEVLSGEGKSYSSDVYAFGMTIVEILSGNLPFSQYSNNVAVITAVVLRDERPPRTPAAAQDGTSYDREWDVAEQCWAKEVDKRVSIDQAIIKLNTPKGIPSTNTGSLSWRHGQVQEINKNEELPQNKSDINTSRSRDLVEDVGHAARPNVGQDITPQGSYYLQTMNSQQGGSFQGENEEAIISYFDAPEISTGVDDREMTVDDLLVLAQAYKSREEYSKAATLFVEALEITSDINENRAEPRAPFGLAEVNLHRREYDQAVGFYTDALRISTEMGDQQGRASALRGLGEMHRLQHHYEQAITLYYDALQIYNDIGDSRGRAFALLRLANVSDDQGRPKDAIDLYQQAYTIYKEIGDDHLAAKILERFPNAR